MNKYRPKTFVNVRKKFLRYSPKKTNDVTKTTIINITETQSGKKNTQVRVETRKATKAQDFVDIFENNKKVIQYIDNAGESQALKKIRNISMFGKIK